MNENSVMEMTFSKEENSVKMEKQQRPIKMVTGKKDPSQVKLPYMFATSQKKEC